MSLVNWEKNRTEIGARFVPTIVQWLGYDPLPKASSFGEWIAIERNRRGLARRALAAALGWDEATFRRVRTGCAPAGARKLTQLRAVFGEPSSST
jgi:hypothetical protein